MTIQINPAKLLLSKWTAVKSVNKEKHFLVTKLIEPENEGDPLEWIELEAIYSKRIVLMGWRELKNQDNWLQGWK
jgi:tryptophan-rich hypothetical protein